MQKFQDAVLDHEGDIVPGATVSVVANGTSTLSSIFSDNGVTAKANPFTTSAVDGSFSFYAANGRYDIIVAPSASYGGKRYDDVLLFDGGSSGSAEQPLNRVVVGSGSGLTSSANFTYDPTTGDLNSSAPSQSGSSASGNITLVAGSRNNGLAAPGAIALTSGSGTAAGGAISLTAGAASASGSGGGIALTGGAGTGGNGGNLALTGGQGTGADGGLVTITAGQADGANSGGVVTITGGLCSGSGVGGDVSVTAGACTTGNGGALSLISGAGAVGGDVEIIGGEGATGDGGAVTVDGGHAVGVSGTGGSVTITGGVGPDGGGGLTLTGGDSDATAGGVTISGGTGGLSTIGSVSITGGAVSIETDTGAGLDFSGNNITSNIDGIEFTSTSVRFTGDFSNATHSNRLLFQSSNANDVTNVGAIPSGTGAAGQFVTYSSSDPDNSHQLQIGALSSTNLCRINSQKTGTGTTRDVIVSFDGTEKFRITTGGQLQTIDGTAGTPALAPTSDPDTGFYSLSANNGGLAAGGSAAFRWEATKFGHPSNYTAVIADQPIANFLYHDGNNKLYTRSLMLAEAGDTPDLAIRRYNGTPSAPTAVLNGEIVGVLYFQPMGSNNDFHSSTPGSPHYGRIAQIHARCAETPTGTNRGGALVFATTKESEVVLRERVWLDANGWLVAGGRASYEDGTGLDSSNTEGVGNVTILSTDDANAAALAIRQASGPTNGFDFRVDDGANELLLQYVVAGANTTSFSVARANGNVNFNAGGLFVDKANSRVYVNQTAAFGAATAKLQVTQSGAICAAFNRTSSDGDIIGFYQDNNLEGAITVSGTTVSLTGWAGSHWSQGVDSLPLGTVLSTTDELCEWEGEKNSRLVKCKISDIPGDKRVYGVFAHLDEDGDAVVMAAGEFEVRVTGPVRGGDLLESAGDGTARVQADDIIRSSTLGKVSKTDPRNEDRLVPCVLYSG